MRAPSTRLRAAARALVFALCAPIAAAGLPPTPAPAAQMVVKVFTLKHRKIEDALPLLRPLLSDPGAASAVLETNRNSLTVRGTSARIEQITRAVAAFDVPPRAINIAVTLLKSLGEKTHSEKTDVSQEIRGIGEKLKKLFNVTDFTRLDSVVVQGVEGERVVYVMGAAIASTSSSILRATAPSSSSATFPSRA